MDGYLRNALVYSVLPVVITLAGALLVAFKLLPASIAGGARRFASGATFAAIAIELLPDVLRAHGTTGIAGFGLGVVTMIAAKWLLRGRKRASAENDHRLSSMIISASAGVPVAGLLIGAGMESLVESYEDGSSLRGLLIFFAGLFLFLLLARSLGGSHPAHPGARADDQRPSQMKSPGMISWYNHTHIHPLQIIKRASGSSSG